jgi:hypothetical protein
MAGQSETDRYLQLCNSPDLMEQSLDLQRAITVLAQLKKLHVVERNQQNFVS